MPKVIVLAKKQKVDYYFFGLLDKYFRSIGNCWIIGVN